MRRATPLADIVTPVLGPALAAQGFTGYDLVAAWPEIAGERLARKSRPLKVVWPRRRQGAGRDPGAGRDEPSEPATLVIRVESAFALEAQHLAPLLVERINAVYGWRCVGRILLKQGPVPAPAGPPPEPPTPTPEQARRIRDAVAEVADAALAGALRRLGSAVAGAAPASAGLPSSTLRSSATAPDEGVSP